MNNYQSCYLMMLHRLVSTARSYPGIIASIPFFVETLDELESICNQLFMLTADQAAGISGTTAIKKECRQDLILFAADDSNKLFAYAKVNNDVKLQAEVKFSKSDLRNMSDVSLLSCADLLYQRAETNLEVLANFGITAESLAQQKERCDTFLKMINAPRNKLMKQARTTSSIADLIIKAKNLVKKLDTLVKIIQLSQPEFFTAYSKARKITITGKGYIALRGTVTDATTGKPVIGATITITAIDGTPALADGPITKVSAQKGGFIVKLLNDGMYRLQASKPGFTDSFKEVAVSNTNLTVVELKLEKRQLS